jgi:hypothetical protein
MLQKRVFTSCSSLLSKYHKISRGTIIHKYLNIYCSIHESTQINTFTSLSDYHRYIYIYLEFHATSHERLQVYYYRIVLNYIWQFHATTKYNVNAILPNRQGFHDRLLNQHG